MTVAVSSVRVLLGFGGFGGSLLGLGFGVVASRLGFGELRARGADFRVLRLVQEFEVQAV